MSAIAAKWHVYWGCGRFGGDDSACLLGPVFSCLGTDWAQIGHTAGSWNDRPMAIEKSDWSKVSTDDLITIQAMLGHAPFI